MPGRVKKGGWDSLPPEFSYLIEPARRYGQVRSETDVMDYLRDAMTKDEKRELEELGKRINRDFEAIDNWINERRISRDDAASQVYYLIRLLTLGGDAGLLYDEETT